MGLTYITLGFAVVLLLCGIFPLLPIVKYYKGLRIFKRFLRYYNVSYNVIKRNYNEYYEEEDPGNYPPFRKLLKAFLMEANPDNTSNPFFERAFSWSKSPEGWYYWERIAARWNRYLTSIVSQYQLKDEI